MRKSKFSESQIAEIRQMPKAACRCRLCCESTASARPEALLDPTDFSLDFVRRQS